MEIIKKDLMWAKGSVKRIINTDQITVSCQWYFPIY